MENLPITRSFLARVIIFIAAIIWLLGVFLFEISPQLSYYFRIIAAFMIIPGILILPKTLKSNFKNKS